MGYDLHPILLPDFRHDAQALLAESLKSVGRSARLICTSAEELRAGAMHAFCYGEGLLAGLNAAGAGHDREARTADRRIRVSKGYDRIVGLYVAADQFVRFRDLDYFLHTGHFVERSLFDLAFIASDA